MTLPLICHPFPHENSRSYVGTETTVGIVSTLMGPSRDEVWAELCQRIQAQRVDSRVWSGVVVREHNWLILLDVAKLPSGSGKGAAHTRIRTFYQTREPLTFTLARSNWLSNLGKRLGMRAIAVGDPDFDRAFVLRGRNAAQLRMLFSDATIRNLLLLQPDMHLYAMEGGVWMGIAQPAGTGELGFYEVGVIRDVERLVTLCALFAQMLRQLIHIGVASTMAVELGL